MTKFGLARLRDRLGGQLGFFSGGEMAELLPDIAAHDPVVEAVVWNNVNSGGRHRSGSTRSAIIVTGSGTVP
jgi:hypothetical protein